MVVETEITDRLATVTVNRPEVRNALSVDVLAGIREALRRLRHDDEIEAFEKPTIAAVNGRRYEHGEFARPTGRGFPTYGDQP